MPPGTIVLIAAALIAAWAVYTFNFLIHARAKVREGMSGVDVQLKLRHDLVPNLNEVVRAYVDHEHDAMRAAAAQRSRAIAATRTKDVEAAENLLAAELSRVLALAEDNPELKAAERFRALAHQLVAVEDEIQAARALYNANVEFYNSRAQRIPASLVATWMTPKEFEYLAIRSVNFNALVPRVGEFAA
jgi:LemA protein